MPVVSVRELFNGRGGGVDDSTRMFRVICNSVNDDDQTIIGSGMVPQKGLSHPRNPTLFCTDVKPKQESRTAFHWLTTCTYGRVGSGGMPNLPAKEVSINPLVRRVNVEGKSVTTKRGVETSHLLFIGTMTEWNNGQPSGGLFDPGVTGLPAEPVMTSAYEPIEGQEIDDTEFVFEVTWNVEQIPFYLANLSNAINSDQVTIRGIQFPKWSLKFAGFQHSDLLEQELTQFVSQYYYRVQFNLHYRRQLWITPRIDRGFYKLDEGAQVEILTNRGSRPGVPILLDGAGDVLADPTPETTEYLFYMDYPQRPFNQFLAPLNVQT